MQNVSEDTLKFLQKLWGEGYVVHLAHVGQTGEGGWQCMVVHIRLATAVGLLCRAETGNV